jgi:undecaprenyl-diphosphatase
VAAATYLAVTVAVVALGALLLHTPLGAPVRDWDQSVTRDLVEGRTPGWDDYSSVGTSGADTLPVLGAAVVVTGVLLLLRRVRDLMFIPFALLLEVTIFLTGNVVIGRERPDVVQLGTEPGTHSYPSGHVAATLVLWFGVAMLLRVDRWPWPGRLVAWVVCATVVLTVGFSRVYRGMHFTSDVLVGIGVGALALGGAAVATRASWLASRAGTDAATRASR